MLKQGYPDMAIGIDAPDAVWVIYTIDINFARRFARITVRAFFNAAAEMKARDDGGVSPIASSHFEFYGEAFDALVSAKNLLNAAYDFIKARDEFKDAEDLREEAPVEP